MFHPSEPVTEPGAPYTVLFYGQFIPLHGIDTIIRAARILEDNDVRWILIGKGQEEQKISALLAEHPLEKVKWIPWVPYEELIGWIASAQVCLGIFDAGGKASRVIPNKVFQILAAGKPLITRDSPAIRELVSPEDPGVCLIPPNDPERLAAAVGAIRLGRGTTSGLHGRIRERFEIEAIGRKLADVLSSQ
jgi:glycosyltransferase involved in cell wall biosynthesis